MASLSIGKAWEETVAFVKREAHLLFPVAFLFLALPVVALQQLVPADIATLEQAKAAQLPAGFALGTLLVVLLAFVGSLSIYVLALRPGVSVAEAIGRGLQRTPVLIGSALLLGIGCFVIAMVLGMVVGGISALAFGQPRLSGAYAVLVLFILYVGTRMLLLNAVVADGHLGVFDSLRASWRMTSGHFWRLLGFMIVLLVLVLIVQLAVQAVFGVIGSLIGGAAFAKLFSGLAVAAFSAVYQVYFLVMTARIYLQLRD